MRFHITLVFKNREEISFLIDADSPFLAIKSLYANPYLIFDDVKDIICLSFEEE